MSDAVDLFRDLLQLRYKLGGSPRDGVCDCLTLCAEMYRRLGWRFPLPDGYGDGYVPAEAFVDWAKHWQPAGPDPWVIVEMQLHDQQLHAGVLLPDRHVMHAGRGVGVVLTQLERLHGVIAGYWRLRELQETRGDD